MGAPLSETAPRPDPSPDPTRAARRRRRRLIFAWGLVLGWAGVIWLLGSDPFSASSTSPSLLEWLGWLVSDLDPRSKYRLLVLIRKSAHFIEYAILAILAFRAALLSAPRNPVTTAIWVTLFIVASLAGADEFRQAFSPVRTGSPRDVLIDLSGGTIALIGAALVSRRTRPARTMIRPSL
jgi:VanZ family protein